jgi:hypothetical protein
VIRFVRQYLARQRLARDVERRCNSFEIRDYAKRREAAKRGLTRTCTRTRGKSTERGSQHA